MNSEIERLAAAVARLTGESETEAVRRALADRLERLRRERSACGGSDLMRGLADELDAIARRAARLPVLDDRTDDEILGYDERGLPT